jgi:histidinol-phosphatase (PHP family)
LVDGDARLTDGYVPTEAELAPWLDSYLDAQHGLLQRHAPEVVGHLDLCRLYTPGIRLDSNPEVWARVRRNIELAVGYGALFECNAAAIRKGWDTSYPGREVLDVSQVKERVD